MDVDGLASQQPGARGEDDPMDVNTGGDGGDGDEQPETQEELDVLMKEAEKLLGSPATHKDPKINNVTQSRPGSVTSLVNSLNLNTSPSIPGVPYPTSSVNPPARIQSDSLPGRSVAHGSGAGAGTGTGASTGTGTGSNATTDIRTVTGPGVGSCVGSGVGVTPSSINFQLQGQKRARCDTGTSAGSGCHTGTFPPVYGNVRKTREKNNPFIELPAVDGNRRKVAQCVKTRPGFDLQGDDRQYRVANFHIPHSKETLVQVCVGVMRGYSV
jgi:hypothetical protein